jgi:hypothetical protein
LGKASGNALAIKIKNVRNTIPDPTTIPIYQRIFPMKTNIKTIEKINVVEKFAGRINSNVRIQATRAPKWRT